MKVADLLREDSDEKLDDNQLGAIGGKLEDAVDGVNFDVTSGHTVGEDTYKVFFTWEAGERGEKHGRGTATFTCGFQNQGRHLVAVDFKLTDLTGLRGVNVDQRIFEIKVR